MISIGNSRITKLGLCILSGFLVLSLPALALEFSVPVFEDPAGAKTFQEETVSAGKVYASDLMKADEAVFLEGYTTRALLPGCYRLHVSMAIAPFNAPSIIDIRIIVQCGRCKRTLTIFDFRESGKFIDVPIDFAMPSTERGRIAITWEIGKYGKLARRKAIKQPDLQDDLHLERQSEDDLEHILEDDETDDLVDLGKALAIPARLMVRQPCVEHLGSVAITKVRSDKLLYRLGEKGVLHVTLHNYGASEASGKLDATLITELTDAKPLPGVSVDIPPQAEKTIEIQFTAKNRWGTCARVTFTADCRTKASPIFCQTVDEYFSVHENVWGVALGADSSIAGIMGHSGYANEASIARDAKRMRETYCNWWEKMFWPPDDWGDMTPDRDEWISGQSARWENAENIKAFIAAVKPQGIKSITYGKHCAGGPEAWELVRRHPDWFYTDDLGRPMGHIHTWDLTHWHNIKLHMDKDGRKKFSSDWYGAFPDFRKSEVLEWGIKELLESCKTFGWDGVRFDGHWTAGNDELSSANMRRLKEAMWAFDPHFHFGFNNSWSYGYQTSHTAGGMKKGYDHELREAMAGGGMYMQEAINSWAYSSGHNDRYTSWRDYATKETQAANGVRNLGGSYHFIYALDGLNPDDRLYKFIMGTAAGIHPVYGGHVKAPGCENWGRFLTRWSAFVWDAHLRPVDPGGTLVIKAQQPLWWREWVKERVIDEKTRHLIVHLINPPTDDTIAIQDDPLPLPVKNVMVRVKVPHAQKCMQAVLLDPTAACREQSLALKSADNWAETIVPRVSTWCIVVFEFSGSFNMPAPGPRFTEQPDPVKKAEGRGVAAKPAAYDPLKPDETLYETDSGYNNCPAHGTSDTDALNGIAQVRESGERLSYVGRSWLGPLSPGKYIARLRIKLKDKAIPAREQSLAMTLYTYPGGKSETTDFLFSTDAANERRRLIADNQYHYYKIPFEINAGMMISLIGRASTRVEGNHRFLLDHIIIKQVERYSDARLMEKCPLEPPAELVPGKEPGLDILVVKGWTWDTYQLDLVLPVLADRARVRELWSRNGEAIGFPQKHDDLYKYDVVVLANVGAFGLKYEGRKALKDFVEAGGGLVLLGGMHTLGQGRFDQTFLEELIPVTIRKGRDVRRADWPLVLAPVGNNELLNGISEAMWSQRPVLFWRHIVSPKQRATVLLNAGDEPILITWQIGKGRVVVLAGAALGQPENGEIPFWEWTGWPVLLGNMVQWASGD